MHSAKARQGSAGGGLQPRRDPLRGAGSVALLQTGQERLRRGSFRTKRSPRGATDAALKPPGGVGSNLPSWRLIQSRPALPNGQGIPAGACCCLWASRVHKCRHRSGAMLPGICSQLLLAGTSAFCLLLLLLLVFYPPIFCNGAGLQRKDSPLPKGCCLGGVSAETCAHPRRFWQQRGDGRDLAGGDPLRGEGPPSSIDWGKLARVGVRFGSLMLWFPDALGA